MIASETTKNDQMIISLRAEINIRYPLKKRQATEDLESHRNCAIFGLTQIKTYTEKPWDVQSLHLKRSSRPAPLGL